MTYLTELAKWRSQAKTAGVHSKLRQHDNQHVRPAEMLVEQDERNLAELNEQLAAVQRRQQDVQTAISDLEGRLEGHKQAVLEAIDSF